MKKTDYLSWHSYFMAIAILSAFRSKDRKTQNGACIVDRDNRIIGIGYNGLPRGCDDDYPAYWPAGPAFCIFYGPTPVSTGDQPRAYSPVNVFGRVLGDAKQFKGVSNGAKIKVTSAE